MLLWIIGTGIAAASTGTNRMEAPLINRDFTAIGLTEAYFAAFMSMEGGSGLSNIGEEVKNPSQAIPCALILSSLLVTALYVFTNLAYFVVLKHATIASADATALNFAVESWSTAGALIIAILASVSTFGTLSAGFFSHSRLGFAASRRGHLPSFLSLISIRSSVPVAALLFRGILVVAFATIGSVESVVNCILLVSSFLGLFTPLSQITLRITMKDVPRSVTVPYVFIFLSFAVNLTMIAINVWQSTDYVMLITLGAILLAGTVAYVVFHVNRCVFPGTPIMTQFLQKLLFCETCEKKVMNEHGPPERQRDGQLSSGSGGHDSNARSFRFNDAVRRAR
ncbi:hypothetical protein HPB49_012357 [Dermacentor silvarum]|uniref:Uncharacterized protein n=1 Tax=Dermacentor silvarum TaxID=543639 RepID=A0ACB8C3H4_DERSI|nr:hypothetical protein HPB49_012357 [Dermacentor silvarum]